ncbi:MAG: hypothetical protein SNF33_06040 [Candidatus Algichlamydia australiensis]|nr:hypothetical protein [Chlamydiales bacterium]
MKNGLGRFIEHRFSKKENWFPSAILSWIESSQKEPEKFYEELLGYCQKKLALSLDKYDFYQSAVLQHLGKNATALSIMNANGVYEEWSYEKLHLAVNYQVNRWRALGLSTGQCVAIVAPVSPHYFVAYLTALRLGLSIAYFPLNDPFLSKAVILQKLMELKPFAVITSEEDFPKDPSYETIELLELPESKNNYTPTSTNYSPETTTQIFIGTYSKTFLTLTPLSAKNLYFAVLRDAVALLGLVPGSTLAYPLGSSLYHPNILNTLFLGARFLHVDSGFLKKNPQCMAKEKVHVFGLSKAAMTLWEETPGVPSSSLKLIYKSPFDQRCFTFKAFAVVNKIEKVSSANLLIDNSAGGVTLFSKLSLDFPELFMLPNIGLSWELSDLKKKEKKSLRNFGSFSVSGMMTPLLLVKNDQGYILSDSQVPSRDGKPFPVEKIESAISSIPVIESASLFHAVKGGTIANRVYVLLVFTYERGPSLEEAIHNTILDQVGEAYLPDYIEYYPLHPKTQAGQVDKNWCKEQYATGLLDKKSNIEIYKKLSQLQTLLGR